MFKRAIPSILSLAAALPLLLATACRKEADAVAGGHETAVLSFDVSAMDAQTKSAGTYDNGDEPSLAERETIHDDLDIFVFDASTGDLAYQRHHSTEPLTVTAKGKTYNVYAVANMNTRNASLYSTITKESDLTSMQVTLGGQDGLLSGTQLGSFSYITVVGDDDSWNEFSHFLMVSGKQTVSVYSEVHLSMTLRRIVSKVRVTGTASLASGFKEHFVDTRYQSDYYDYYPLISGPFICCVPRKFSLFGSGMQATSNPADTWRSHSSFLRADSYLLPQDLYDGDNWDTAGQPMLGDQTSWYVCENAAPALTSDYRLAYPDATDCCTKLFYIVLIWQTDGDDTTFVDCWYYPIAIPKIGRNEVYTIRNVTITGPGSDDPYIYPGDNSNYESNISYTIEVKDWSTGRLSKIISGGLNKVDEGSSAITI